MNVRISFGICFLAGVFLLSACNGSAAVGSTGTPDPMLMSLEERTIWEFDNFRDAVNDLGETVAGTPTEEQEPILRQMSVLAEEIKAYKFPLFAAQTHSALYNFANFTFQCYMIKYDVSMNEMSDEDYEFYFGDFDRCERAQEYEETYDLYLQEMKEINAGE